MNTALLSFLLLNLACVCLSSHPAVDPSAMRAIYANNNNDNVPNAPVARVQGKAPAFQADAVINGEFKSITLDDYKGSCLSIMNPCRLRVYTVQNYIIILN